MNNNRLFENSKEVQVTFYNYYTTTSQQRNCLHTPDEVLCCLNGHTAGTTMFILETTVSIHNFVTVFINLIKITAFSGEMLGSSCCMHHWRNLLPPSSW